MSVSMTTSATVSRETRCESGAGRRGTPRARRPTPRSPQSAPWHRGLLWRAADAPDHQSSRTSTARSAALRAARSRPHRTPQETRRHPCNQRCGAPGCVPIRDSETVANASPYLRRPDSHAAVSAASSWRSKSEAAVPELGIGEVAADDLAEVLGRHRAAGREHVQITRNEVGALLGVLHEDGGSAAVRSPIQLGEQALLATPKGVSLRCRRLSVAARSG